MEKREKKIEELKMVQNSINFGVFVGLMLVLLFQVSQSITRLKEFIQDRELHVILDYKKPLVDITKLRNANWSNISMLRNVFLRDSNLAYCTKNSIQFKGCCLMLV